MVIWWGCWPPYPSYKMIKEGIWRAKSRDVRDDTAIICKSLRKQSIPAKTIWVSRREIILLCFVKEVNPFVRPWCFVMMVGHPLVIMVNRWLWGEGGDVL
jgi:hypothetical protein